MNRPRIVSMLFAALLMGTVAPTSTIATDGSATVDPYSGALGKGLKRYCDGIVNSQNTYLIRKSELETLLNEINVQADYSVSIYGSNDPTINDIVKILKEGTAQAMDFHCALRPGAQIMFGLYVLRGELAHEMVTSKKFDQTIIPKIDSLFTKIESYYQHLGTINDLYFAHEAYSGEKNELDRQMSGNIK